MGTIAGPLRGALEAVVPGLRSKRIRETFPAHIAEISPELYEELAVKEKIERLLVFGGYDHLLNHVLHLLKDRDTSAGGVRLSEMALVSVYADIHANAETPDAASAAAAPLFDWYANAGGNPDVAAIVARAIQILGHIHRGEAVAGEETEDERRALTNHLAEAERMLMKAAHIGQSRELWHRTRFKGGLLDCPDPAERAARFERFVAFDPGNIMTYTERGFQLLPRWQGSFEAVEQFALNSVQRTVRSMGGIVYWKIYDDLAELEDLREAHLDRAILQRGYEDAMARFVPEVEANRYISLIARLGDKETTRQLFEDLPELRLDQWPDRDLPLQVYAWANDEGPWPFKP